MSRPAKEPARPAPPPISPVAVKVAVAVIILGLCALGVVQLERVNARKQIERRMQEDPQLASWFRRMQGEIEGKEGESSRPSGRPSAQALWVGRIRSQSKNSPNHERPKVIGLDLDDCTLLLGEKGATDKRSVIRVSCEDYSFRGGLPAPNEQWAIAVWRDSKGGNFIRDAVPLTQ